MTDSKPGPGRSRAWIGVALLALLAGVNALRNDLVYDADALVRQNATLAEAAGAESVGEKIAKLGRVFQEGFWDGVNRTIDPVRQILGQALYRPLFLFTLGVVRLAAGTETTWPYHAVNLLFHVLASILVWRLALWISSSRRVALIAGALFAVHPIHAEAVAYAAGLGETQSTALALLAAVLYLTGARSGRTSVPRLVLALAAFAAAILTKEGAATLVPILIVADFARRDAPRPAVRAAFVVGMLAVVAGDLYVRYRLFGRIAPDPALIGRLDNPLVGEGFVARLATGVTLYARALQLFLLPIGQSADYSFNQLPIARSLLDPAALSAFLLCVLLTIAAAVTLRRAPAFGFGLFTFLFAYGAVSNIPVPIGTIFAERLLYLPSAGLAIAAAHLLSGLLAALERRRREVGLVVARGALIAVVFVLLVAHWQRNQVYASPETLYRDMVRTAPDSARAWYQRGELERQHALEGDRQALNAAAFDFRRAMEILPEFLLARLQLADVLAQLGKFDEAMRLLKESEKMIPEGEAWDAVRGEIQRRRAFVLARATSTPDPQERQRAIDELVAMMEEYLSEHPDDPGAAVELGVVYLKVGRLEDARRLTDAQRRAHPDDPALLALDIQVSFQSGDLDRGERLLEEFEKLGEVDNLQARKVADLYRGLLHLQRAFVARNEGDEQRALGEFGEAARLLDRYVQLYPDDDQGYYWRGFVLHEAFPDRYAEALRDYQQAVKMNPANQDAFFRLAQLLVAKGEVNAITLRYFQELAKIHKENGFFFVGYGHVASQLGRYEEAEKAFSRAIELGFNGANVHASLAMALIEQGKPEQALEHIRRAEKEFDLRDPQLENLKGVALLELDQPERALKRFEIGLKMVQQDETGRWRGLGPQLRLQIAKAKLRIPGRESEGLRELVDLGDSLEQTIAQASDAPVDRTLKELLVYVYVQRAWARRHVESMRDDQAALTLLEKARALCDEHRLDRPRPDVLEPLAELYDELGRSEEAAQVRAELEKIRAKANIKIVEKPLPAGAAPPADGG